MDSRQLPEINPSQSMCDFSFQCDPLRIRAITHICLFKTKNTSLFYYCTLISLSRSLFAKLSDFISEACSIATEKNGFAEISKNLARYRSKISHFVELSK